MSGLEPERLTWAVLLAQWTEFARSAVALPEAGEAGLVRASVADIIALQAVWFALSHLEELSKEERSLGLDRAGVLIARQGNAIRSRLKDTPLPGELAELIADAESAYRCNKSLQ